jgi:hypothetical protein
MRLCRAAAAQPAGIGRSRKASGKRPRGTADFLVRCPCNAFDDDLFMHPYARPVRHLGALRIPANIPR